MSKRKVLIGLAWLALIAGTYYFHSKLTASGDSVQRLASGSIWWAYTFYFLLGCVRGFTFMPLTVLIGFGILFLQPIPLFILSLAGMLVSRRASITRQPSLSFTSASCRPTRSM